MKANGNAAFALSLPLDKQANIDWALIALFYAGMHYVEAYLAPSFHLKSHEARDSYLAKESHLRRIYKEYQHLKYFGFNARYEVCGFKSEDVTNEAAQDYETVKTHISSRL
jgi:hypothetical protein